MATWHEAKIRYDKIQENGAAKKVTESYLLDSVTCTEAEAKVVEKIAPYVSGEFSVPSVKKTAISEIFFDESDYADRWYLVKVIFTTYDEKSGKAKKTVQLILVQAGNFENALERFHDGMRGNMSDYRIASISETQIMDVFRWEAE